MFPILQAGSDLDRAPLPAFVEPAYGNARKVDTSDGVRTQIEPNQVALDDKSRGRWKWGQLPSQVGQVRTKGRPK